MSAFPIGSMVRVKNPDDFKEEVARRLRNRVGVVERHQYNSGNAIVVFAEVGRRRMFTWVAPSDRYLESA